MRFLAQMFHHRKVRRCLKAAAWNGDTLKCQKCGRIIALRYQIGDEIKVFTFPEFEGYRDVIRIRKDTQEITEKYDLVGAIHFGCMSSILDCLRPSNREIYNVPEDARWTEGNRIEKESSCIGGNCGEYDEVAFG